MNRRAFLKASGALAMAPAAGCVTAGGMRVGSPYDSAIPTVETGLVVNDLHSQLNLTRVDAIVKPRTVEELRTAQLLWATVDSPWVQTVDVEKYLRTFDSLKDRKPDLVLSTHLPPAAGITGAMLDTLATAPSAPPFVGPDQVALEQMLASFQPDGGGP